MAHRWSELKQRRTRRRKRGPVAFVMSGGGPLGAVQVGVIRALLEKGIVPDLTVGTSVGALNAVFLAASPDLEGAERLADAWLQMRRDDLFPGGKLVSAWHAVKRGSYVFSNTGLRRIIESGVDARDFSDLVIPAYVATTDLATGEECWFSSGSLTQPLLASCAMPGVFPPVEMDGKTFIDGGVANNVPVSKAVELGAAEIYILNVNAAGQARPLTRPHEFMMHGFVLARAQRYRQEIAKYKDAARIIEMPIADVGHVSFTNLSQTARLIDAGYEAAKSFLESPAPVPLLAVASPPAS